MNVAASARPIEASLSRFLTLALPVMAANITEPLIGIVDTAAIGRLGDVALVGAVALSAVLFEFLFWGLGALRMSTAGLTAQALGAGDVGGLAGDAGEAIGQGVGGVEVAHLAVGGDEHAGTAGQRVRAADVRREHPDDALPVLARHHAAGDGEPGQAEDDAEGVADGAGDRRPRLPEQADARIGCEPLDEGRRGGQASARQGVLLLARDVSRDAVYPVPYSASACLPLRRAPEPNG